MTCISSGGGGASGCRYYRRASERRLLFGGTQFTCFTGTQVLALLVQILTQTGEREATALWRYSIYWYKLALLVQTSTKVQILTQKRYSASCALQAVLSLLALLALLAQKYKD